MSPSFAGKTWCYNCGRTPPVQGARYVDSITLNVTCNNCDEPLRTKPDGVAWVYDEDRDWDWEDAFEAAHTERCLLCGKKVLMCFCKNSTTTCVPLGVVLPLEERVDINLKAALRKMKMQTIDICKLCNRPCGPYTPRRKCTACGNANKYEFQEIKVPAGLVYRWCEQRLERDCVVLL